MLLIQTGILSAYVGVTQVSLITDGGAPNKGETNPNTLAQMLRERGGGKTRLDACLVTQPPNDNLASRLAQESKGVINVR